MCGRFAQTIDIAKLAYELSLPAESLQTFSPRYNVAPSQPVLALIRDRDTKERKPHLLRWGLVPSWAKDPAIGNKMINARAETITEKPSYRGPFKNSRCLIPADGFYEWKPLEGGKGKQPHFIRLKSQRPFTFAGLWSHWTGPDGTEIRSATIITTEANEVLRDIHARMPVILPAQDRDAWLDPTLYDTRRLHSLLKPYPGEMEAYPVSLTVNSPNNDTPACLHPL